MAETKKARLGWISLAEGGREPPPVGVSYSVPAKFESVAQEWPDEAWSVVLDIQEQPGADGSMFVGIRLLVPENAPAGLLNAGSRFEVFEGRRRVAVGEVVESAETGTAPGQKGRAQK